MRWQTAFLALLASAASSQAPATEAVAARDLRVVYIGDAMSDRARAFANFLMREFGAGSVVDRSAVDVDKLQRDADVVLLDWPQKEGVMRWFQKKDQCTEAASPLGPRDAWHTPTVLLGSAGLNMACVWEVKGGSG